MVGAFAFTWTDYRGAAALAAAVKRARAGAWSCPPPMVQVADLRALMAHGLVAVCALGQTLSFSGSEARCNVDPARLSFGSAERQAAARAIAVTPMILAQGGLPDAPSLATHYPGSDAAGWPAVVAVVAVCVAVSALSAAYVADRADKVIDRQLSREESTRRLVASQAAAVALVQQHAQLESDAGKPLPFSAEASGVLRQLQAAQSEILAQREAPLPPASGLLDGVMAGGAAAAAAVFLAMYFLASEG